MIIVDLSQTIISNCIVNINELKTDDASAKNFIKHLAYSSFLSYKKHYGKEYGKILLACDSTDYWRRDYFPAYKGHRKHSHDADNINWDVIYEAINEIKKDLREHFPYKVIEVNGAEADDVIACICKHLQNNDTTSDGLFEGEPQKILILSSDGDFIQLQKYPNVKQWSPIQKKFVTPKGKVQDYIVEHICTGDSGDNVPNILTSDQWAIDRANNLKPTRQKSMYKERIANFIKNGIDECSNEEEKRNFIRNQTLVDFEQIPKDIYDSVVKEYESQNPKGNSMKLMMYFSKNRMPLLFSSSGDF